MRARGYIAVAGFVLLGVAGLVYLSLRGGSAVAVASGDDEVTREDPREAAIERSGGDDPERDPAGAAARSGPQRPRATPEQRERARLAREKILEAARRWPGASERSGGAKPAAPGAGEVPPVLDREYIGYHIRENFFPLAKDCYQSLLASQPKAGGLVEIHMTLVGDEGVGSVVDSLELGEKSTMKDPEFLDCVSESMMSMVFEPPPEHGWVTVVYPVEFAPGNDAG